MISWKNARTIACISFLAQAALPANARAESIDLRAELSPVKNQGSHRNTCSAFAATALAEFVLQKETGQVFDLSESFAYWASKNYALDTPFLKNLYEHFDGQAGFLAVKAYEYGALPESAWRYSELDPKQAGDPLCTSPNPSALFPSSCFTGEPPADALSQVLSYRFHSQAIDREKMGAFILKEQKPLVFNLTWYFAAVDSKGDFRMPTAVETRACEARGEGCSGHVVLLSGYDSNTRRFVFRNSWGETWGSSGYGTLPEAYVLKHCESCRHLNHLDKLSPDERAFVLTASHGFSATLRH